MARKSRQKEAILKVLGGTAGHPDADWILREVRREMPHISLGTVYRNLKTLVEEGRVKELKLSDGMAHFDAKITSHNHFRCDKCGRIVDLEPGLDAPPSANLARQKGLQVTHYSLELGGFCAECRQSEIENKPGRK